MEREREGVKRRDVGSSREGERQSEVRNGRRETPDGREGGGGESDTRVMGVRLQSSRQSFSLRSPLKPSVCSSKLQHHPCSVC